MVERGFMKGKRILCCIKSPCLVVTKVKTKVTPSELGELQQDFRAVLNAIHTDPITVYPRCVCSVNPR
ncbi:hypothetical protein M0804_004930 [Polistes exclamans]|nr:hypothetical protein M0804_004930 [Polistes exclamans]